MKTCHFLCLSSITTSQLFICFQALAVLFVESHINIHSLYVIQNQSGPKPQIIFVTFSWKIAPVWCVCWWGITNLLCGLAVFWVFTFRYSRLCHCLQTQLERFTSMRMKKEKTGQISSQRHSSASNYEMNYQSSMLQDHSDEYILELFEKMLVSERLLCVFNMFL